MKWGFKGTKEMAKEIIETAFSRAIWHPRIRDRLRPEMEIKLWSGGVNWYAREIDGWDYGEIRWNARVYYKGKEFGTSGWTQPRHGTAYDEVEKIKERWITETMWDMIAKLEYLLDYIQRLEAEGKL